MLNAADAAFHVHHMLSLLSPELIAEHAATCSTC